MYWRINVWPPQSHLGRTISKINYTHLHTLPPVQLRVPKKVPLFDQFFKGPMTLSALLAVLPQPEDKLGSRGPSAGRHP